MQKPLILVLDDDEQVLRSITRDLRTHYKDDFRVVSASSAKEALQGVQDFKKKGQVIALLVIDQRMPEMLGVDFIKQAKEHFPHAKRTLLTAYSDTDAAIRAINEVQLDYYFVKPWDPPEEKLYPVLDDLLEDWKAGYKPAYSGIKIAGFQYSAQSHELKDFLAGNLIPYKWLEVEKDPEAKQLLQEHNCSHSQLPLIVFEDNEGICKPNLQQVAEKIGLKQEAADNLYDVVIIGGGPAGLAAAVYGASEGLSTLLIEKRAPGGQAGTSSRIENYLGFPKGLSGSDLTRRAVAQATRFGTEILAPQEVKEITIKDGYKILTLTDGNQVKCRSIVITTGVSYRQLEEESLEAYNGQGVYYGAAMTEAKACEQQKVFIVGGGNSAGQAAMYLAQYASEVTILIRGESLESSMSQYLIEQINQTENIRVWNYTEVSSVNGNDKLERLCLFNNMQDKRWEEEASALFIFIGAKPRTDWLPLNIITDKKGFIETGRSLTQYNDYEKFWKINREPYLLETCSPGIFAAGDVRAGAMNRVASAVGEGAMAIKFVHQYLAEA